ncbi:protein FAM98B-like isoform X1 [Huso huso]|uniref:Protein FAM98B-like isoform X1 n=1 Tax=Huso huso TaxID=61971 RepID=A0ABR0Z2P0_HUSHU
MEYDILDTLDDLGYTGPLLEEDTLVKAAENGLFSPEYINLCLWLTSQLKHLSLLQESISASADDPESFQLEVSGLLKEMACPYPTLISGNIKDRLKKKEDCLKLILYLSSELQAARVLQGKLSQVHSAEGKSEVNLDLKAICKTLKLPEPSSMTSSQLFPNIETKIKDILAKAPNNCVGKPIFKQTLTLDQWVKLEKINAMLSGEYECRRRMLIKRLDVTVQSFSWSERAKAHTDNTAKAYQPKRHALSIKSIISVAHLLAAREDLSNIIKTSSGSTRERTACPINKILMGKVPDRGGRPSEIDAPPPEMPPWQKRQDGGGRGGWGGRGGGRGRGGGGGFRGRGGQGEGYRGGRQGYSRHWV